MPVLTQHVEKFRDLFRGNESNYGQFQDKPEKSIKTVAGLPTIAQWQQHLEGKGPFMGQIPIRENDECYFGAIDYDNDDADHAQIAASVVKAGLPLIVCRSKSGGAHLYLFLRDPAPARIVRDVLHLWAEFLGIKNDDKRPIEIFPKQASLRPGQVGNWINLPYYGATRHAVSPNGQTLTLDEFLAVAEAKTVAHGLALQQITPNGINPFIKGPPCLQHLHTEGFPEGTRNAGLYNVGIFFKISHPTDWQQRLHEYNVNSGVVSPPLKGGEVDSIVNSLSNKSYSYNCDDAPIQPHCKRRECKKREFGISTVLGDRQKENFPDVTKLRKISTDPPRWIINISNQDIELTTDELMSLAKMRRVVLERANVVLPSLRPDHWDDLLRDLIRDVTVIEAPEDAGIFGQFTMLVEQFCTRRRSSETREDILAGLPFAEEGKIFFRSQDLTMFLQRKRFYSYSTGEIYTALRRLKAGHQSLRIRGNIVQCWFVPDPGAQEELPAPKDASGPTF